MLENEAKTRVNDVQHEKFSWIAPYNNHNTSKTLNFPITSSQKNFPCFLISPNYDGIIIRNGINGIKKMCKHMNHQIQMFTKSIL